MLKRKPMIPQLLISSAPVCKVYFSPHWHIILSTKIYHYIWKKEGIGFIDSPCTMYHAFTVILCKLCVILSHLVSFNVEIFPASHIVWHYGTLPSQILVGCCSGLLSFSFFISLPPPLPCLPTHCILSWTLALSMSLNYVNCALLSKLSYNGFCDFCDFCEMLVGMQIYITVLSPLSTTNSYQVLSKAESVTEDRW